MFFLTQSRYHPWMVNFHLALQNWKNIIIIFFSLKDRTRSVAIFDIALMTIGISLSFHLIRQITRIILMVFISFFLPFVYATHRCMMLFLLCCLWLLLTSSSPSISRHSVCIFSMFCFIWLCVCVAWHGMKLLLQFTFHDFVIKFRTLLLLDLLCQ